MERKNTLNHLCAAALLVGLLGLPSAARLASGEPLGAVEADGYLQWLHSLQQEVKVRTGADAPEGNLLYPFDLPGWTGAEAKPYRHLAISKAIGELEAQWQLRGQNRESSALVALAHARNYTNLSEFDSAMVWYEAAGQLDTLGLFSREISQERMAVSAALGDSLGMAERITNTLGVSDLTGREREVVLAYRWLLTGRDSETLAQLVAKVESQPELLQGQVLYWHAFSQGWLEQRPACLASLRTLLRGGGLSQGLTESQRAWVLAAVPDLMFLLGDVAGARQLYETLAGSSLEALQTWAVYQLANLDFLAADYGKAANGFGLVCEAVRRASWQDQACAMADVAHELDRIRTESEPYGTAEFFKP